MNESLLIEKSQGEAANPNLISEVKAIETGGHPINRRTDIEKWVEKPLVQSCEKLYDLNIETLMSSANYKDVDKKHGYIDINPDSLSEENRDIANRLVQEEKAELTKWHSCGEGYHTVVRLLIPITADSTVDEINKYALKLVNNFVKQKMTWANRYPLDGIGKILCWEAFNDMTPQEIESETGFYYDPETQTFFHSKEQCLKSKEGI